MLLVMLGLFAALSSGSIVAAAFSGSRYESVLPLTVMAICMLLYVFYLFDLLVFGFWFVLSVCAFCYVVSAVAIIRRKNLKEVISRFITPGFVVFLAIYIFMFFRLQNLIVTYWDELRLWGAAPKILFYTNAWLAGDTMLYKSMQFYPVAMPLFQYLLQRMNGQFKEGYLFVAYVIFSFAFLMPMMKNVKWKQYWLMPVAALLLIALPMLFFNSNYSFNNFYANIFIDAALGIVFGYVLALPVLDGKMGAVSLLGAGMALGLLPLLKDSGFFLSILAFAYIAVYLLVFRNKTSACVFPANTKSAAMSALIKIAALAAMLVLSESSWKAHIHSFGLGNQFLNDTQSTFSFSIFNPGNAMLQSYVQSLLFSSVLRNAAVPPHRLSFAMVVMLFALLFFVVRFSLAKQHRAKLYLLSSSVMVMGILYVISLYVLYATATDSFGGIIGREFPSYQRYIATLLIGIETFIASYVIALHEDNESPGNKRRIRISVAAALLAFLLVVPAFRFAGFNYLFAGDAGELKSNTSENRATVAAAVENIRSAIPKKARRTDVFLVIQGDEVANALAHHMIYFQLLDDNIFIKDIYYDANVSAPHLASAEEKKAAHDAWTESLQSCGYVYLYKVDSDFVDQYSSIFQNGGRDIAENRMYRVVRTEGGVLLE
jgi:hypothetical protein